MSTTEDMLNNDIELAKGVGQMAEAVNQAIGILAAAILELEDPEGHHCLKIGTRHALQALAETDE